MRQEIERAWDAWRDAVLWPTAAVATAALLLVGVLLGGDAVHGDTVSRVALVPGALGGGYLVVTLPRQTLMLRAGAFIAALALGRYVFGTPPPGYENTPPSLILDPTTFYAVHESLVIFTVLVVIVEPIGAWLVRPLDEPTTALRHASGPTLGSTGPNGWQHRPGAPPAQAPSAAPSPNTRPDFSSPPGRPRPGPAGRRNTHGRRGATVPASDPAQQPSPGWGSSTGQGRAHPGAQGGWSSPSPPERPD